MAFHIHCYLPPKGNIAVKKWLCISTRTEFLYQFPHQLFTFGLAFDTLSALNCLGKGD